MSAVSKKLRVRENAQVLYLLKASINLVAAKEAMTSAGENVEHVVAALAQVDQGIQTRLHGRGGK